MAQYLMEQGVVTEPCNIGDEVFFIELGQVKSGRYLAVSKNHIILTMHSLNNKPFDEQLGDITTQEGKLALENAQKKKISEYYKKSNGKTKLSFEEAKKEIVAQRMAEMLNNPQSGYSALTELANHDLATARGIVNTIKDTYNKIKDKLTHNEGRYYAKFTNFTQYEEAIKLFEKAVRDGVKHSEVNANNKVQFDIGYTTDKLPVVMLKDNIFDGKTGKPHEVISNFIADQIGNGYDISESGQKVYIGEDLPNEYTQSEYTKWILKNRSNLLKVKNQSAQNIKEIIEIATDRRWDKNTKAKHNVDAKYGFYKYTSRVALPVKDSNGNIVRSNIYDVELVIRNDADGKKYLYDIQNINKSVKQLTSTWNSKSVIQAQHSNDIVPQKKIPVNTNSTQNSENYAYSDGNVQNNAMSEALAKAGLTDNTKNDFTDYSDYRNSDNGNVGLLDRDTEGVNQNESVENENGAVDNDDTKFRTKKAEDYYKKAVNTLRKSLSKAFNITNLRNDTRVNEIIKAVTDKHIKNGMVDVKDIDALFEEMYSKGKVINDELYKEYADLRKQLRNTRMFISKEDAGNIADYSDFVKQNMGSFFVSTTQKDGNVEVEAVYNELMEQYPHLFSSEITHPADMLKRIAEVSRSIKKVETELSSYTGEDAEMYKEAAKQDFYNAVSAFSDKLNELYKYEKGAKVPVAEVPDVVLKEKNADLNKTDSNVEIIGFDGADSDYTKFVDIIKENVQKLNNTKPIFNIAPNSEEIGGKLVKGKASEWIYNVFKKFGGKAVNPTLGEVDLTKKGAKTTVFHGFGEDKLLSTYAIKDVIEKGEICRCDNNWKGRGYDTYTIIGKGKLNGKDCVLGVIVKSYPEGNMKNKFYLHEIIKIGELSDTAVENNLTSVMNNTPVIGASSDTAVENNQTNVIDSTPIDNSISNESDIVKENTSTSNNRIEMTEDELIGLYNERKELQDKYKKAEDGILLSDKDKHFLEGLINGKITEADIPKTANIDGIKAVYDLKAQLDFVERSIARYNAIRKENLHKRADSLLENSDNWKEKKIPVLYEVETMKRNIRSMVNDRATADAIIDEYFRPVGDNEALKEKFMRKYRDRIRGLKLVRIKHKANRVSESYAVQFLGELNGEIEHLEERNNLTQEEKLRLEELKETRETFLSENKALKMDKINDAIKVFRETYDELFNEMNRVRVRNGYTPVEYRHNYFPHFAENETDGLLHKFGSMIGVNMDVTELPTNLAGKTHTFKPGIPWMGNVLRRTGNATKYDSLEGFDKYITAIGDVIYHTDDIQRLRAFENAIREKYSKEGVKTEIEQLEEDATVDKETLMERYNSLKERDLTKLGQFTIELREYGML